MVHRVLQQCMTISIKCAILQFPVIFLSGRGNNRLSTIDTVISLFDILLLTKEDNVMSVDCCSVRVGQKVPEFKLETYETTKGDFGEISLASQKASKKWTVLFFYPADFTFV